jgi:hypothetical protein
MTLKEMSQRLRELKPLAEMDLAGVPHYERPVAEGTRRGAMREIAEISAKLASTVKENMLGIFLTGPEEQVKSWVAIAEDGAAAITVDARELYLKLLDEVMATTPDRMELGHNQVAVLLQAIQATAINSGASGLPYISLGKLVGARFDSRAQGAQFIYEHAVYPFLGDELNVLYLQKKVVDEIAKVSYEQSTVPVIVLNATQQEADGGLAKIMFPGGNLSVVTEGPVDKDQVIRAFKKLKETNQKPEKAKKRKQNNG